MHVKAHVALSTKGSHVQEGDRPCPQWDVAVVPPSHEYFEKERAELLSALNGCVGRINWYARLDSYYYVPPEEAKAVLLHGGFRQVSADRFESEAIEERDLTELLRMVTQKINRIRDRIGEQIRREQGLEDYEYGRSLR